MTTQTLTPKDSISLATRNQGDSRLLSALPALDQLVLHAKVIEHTSDDRVHQFRDRLRLAVGSEEHTSELQSLAYLVCRLLLEKKKDPPALQPGLLAPRVPSTAPR